VVTITKLFAVTDSTKQMLGYVWWHNLTTRLDYHLKAMLVISKKVKEISSFIILRIIKRHKKYIYF